MERRPNNSIGSRTVVAIKGLTSSAKAEDLCAEKLLTGDIVEQLYVGGVALSAPFAGGKAALQRELRHLYSSGDTLVQVKVRRGRGKVAELQASIVPDDSVRIKKQYALKAINDSNHVITFTDATEEDCLALQESRGARLVSHLANIQLKDGFVQYSWKKMEQLLPSQRSSMVFSLVFVPRAEDGAVPLYNNVEDTVARAMAWLSAVQASGVPINFLNIQTEPLLTKVSGDQASSCTVSAGSREDLSSIVNTGIYGFEDYHGIDIGVVRAVRLWYAPNVAEMAMMLRPEEGESKLGLSISQTEEGFCYVSSVEDGTVADRAGLKMAHQAARAAGKLLVISRVCEEKITPTMVSSRGSIRCFETTTISQRLWMHRRAGKEARLHVMVWEWAVQVGRGWGGRGRGGYGDGDGGGGAYSVYVNGEGKGVSARDSALVNVDCEEEEEVVDRMTQMKYERQATLQHYLVNMQHPSPEMRPRPPSAPPSPPPAPLPLPLPPPLQDEITSKFGHSLRLSSFCDSSSPDSGPSSPPVDLAPCRHSVNGSSSHPPRLHSRT